MAGSRWIPAFAGMTAVARTLGETDTFAKSMPQWTRQTGKGTDKTADRFPQTISDFPNNPAFARRSREGGNPVSLPSVA
jgi:hypothetical protein